MYCKNLKSHCFDRSMRFYFGVYFNKLISRFQEVFLTIRRQKTTIFADLKETNTVHDLKKIIHGILKFSPEDQVLYDGVNEQVRHSNLEWKNISKSV